MLKKLIVSLISIFLLFSLFTGCQNNENSESKEQPSSQLENNAETEEKTLYLMLNMAQHRDVIIDYLDLFVEKYKEDKEIELSYELEFFEQRQPEILRTKLASGADLDIYSLHPINDGPQFDKAGYIHDLSDQPLAEKILDSVNPFLTSDSGKLRGVPIDAVVFGYLYNKRIFDEVGIEPAMTISEMENNCEKLKANGYTPWLLTYKEQNIPQVPVVNVMSQLIKTKLPDFSERMYNDNGSFMEAKEYIFNVIDLLHKYGTERPLDVGTGEGASKFANEEAAMWAMGPWMATSILEANPEMDFSQAPLPISDDPNDTLIMVGLGTMITVSEKAHDMDLALDFINFWLDDEHSSQLYSDMKQVPVATVHNYENHPWNEEPLKYMKEGKSCIDYQRPSAVVMELGKMIQAYYLDSSTQDEVLQSADKAWQESNKNQ